MARVSLALVFALVLVLPLLGSVLGDDNPWASVLDQASKAGISQDTMDQAQKVIGDGSAQKAAEDVLGNEGSSLGDWVQQADDTGTNGGSTPAASSPAEAQSGSLDDEDDDIDDSARGAPQASSPSGATEEAPPKAPKLAQASAPVGSPNLAPKSAPTEAPESAPTQAPYASSSYGF